MCWSLFHVSCNMCTHLPACSTTVTVRAACNKRCWAASTSTNLQPSLGQQTMLIVSHQTPSQFTQRQAVPHTIHFNIAQIFWSPTNSRWCHSYRLYSHGRDCKVNFDQLFSAFWPLTMLIFRALTVDCVEYQPLTVDYAHIYGSIQKNA